MLIFDLLAGSRKPALAAIVRAIVLDHFRRNKILRAHRYPLIKRFLFWSAKHPAASMAAVTAIYSVSIVTAALLERAGLLPPSEGQPATPMDLNGYVLGAQATLVGLVFPLVIAFVGLLNQGRASFASRLTIYIEDSNAIFVGVSSLLLCVTISCQLLLNTHLAGATGAIISGINVFWLAMNIAALGHFVLRTIAFLHPARSSLIVKEYVANVAWRSELMDLVTDNRWRGAEHYGYLPKGDDSDWQGKTRASVWYSAMWTGGDQLVSRHLKRSMRLTDVRFGVVRSVLNTWLAKARSTDGEKRHDFVLPLRPGAQYSGDVVLARATLPVGPLSRWALGAAFKFKGARSDPAEIREVARVLREMIADLIALIDNRHEDEFSSQIGSVWDFHAFLLEIGQIADQDFNYAQLAVGFGSQSEEWVRQYSDMLQRAVEQLSREASFFGRCCYIGSAIFQRCRDRVSPDALKALLSPPNWLFYRMMDWAEAEHIAESPTGVVARPFRLKRNAQAHERAWRDYVGGWEDFLRAIAERPKTKDQSWDDLRRGSDNLFRHLYLTAEMVGRAAWAGDELATSWTADLLLHWRALATRDWDMHGSELYGLRSEEATQDLLALSWNDIDGAQFQAGRGEVSPANLYVSIIHNSARDNVIAMACICIHWANDVALRPTTARAARMLLNREYHDLGDTGVTSESAPSAAGILVSLIRIAGARGKHHASISGLAEALGEFRRAAFVSGRMYSGHGGLGFRLHTAHALAIMARATDAQGVDERLRRLVTSAPDEALRERENYLTELLNAFEHISAERHQDLVAALTGDDDAESFAVRQVRARDLVAAVLAELQGRREAAIVDAQVDPERLHAVAVAASSGASDTTIFPLHLFAEVVATADELKKFTLRMSGVRKGVYTKPRMAQAAVNEDDYWRTVMRQQVASIVWDDAYREIANGAHRLEGNTPEAFWMAAREGVGRIRQAGADPILVVGRVEPPWLSDWRWTHRTEAPRPEDLTITEETGQGAGYQFSMNGTPVYGGSTFRGEALLFPRAALRKLRLHEYPSALRVAVNFEPDAADKWEGALLAEFQRDVEVADVEAFTIVFAESGADEGDAEDVS